MPKKIINIVCVFKTHKFQNKDKVIEYTASHVKWLRDMISAHLTIPYRFICLTDDLKVEKICKVIPLIHKWPGWWSKMELFRPGLFSDPVFYIDLDTVILNNIDDMAAPNGKDYFFVLKNLSRGVGFGTGLMAWDGDYSLLYERFLKHPDVYMKRFTSSSHYGDQGFLQVNFESVSYWQDFYPDRILSYYFDLYSKGIKNPPGTASIVCAHGLPKPWDFNVSWVPPLNSNY